MEVVMKVEVDRTQKISTRIVPKVPKNKEEANQEIHIVVPVRIDDMILAELVIPLDFHEGETEDEVVGDMIRAIEKGESLGLPHWKR
jgi:hypothetical protein